MKILVVREECMLEEFQEKLNDEYVMPVVKDGVWSVMVWGGFGKLALEI